MGGVSREGESLRFLSKSALLMLLPLFAACARSPAPIRGLRSAPERIVSLSPGITQSIFEMGFGPKLVGVGRFDRVPEAARKLPRVGGYVDPNWEAILRLKPDLMLVMESQEDIQSRAESLGLSCVRIDQHDLSAVLGSFEQIASACGNPGIGRILRNRVENRLAEISARVRDQPKPRALVVVGRNPGEAVRMVWAAAPGSLYDDLLRLAGGVNVVREDGYGPYPEISREGILSLDPDVVIDLVTTSPELKLDSRQLLRDWDSLAPLRALRAGKIHLMSEAWLTVPGPRVVESLEAFSRVLHPGES